MVYDFNVYGKGVSRYICVCEMLAKHNDLTMWQLMYLRMAEGSLCCLSLCLVRVLLFVYIHEYFSLRFSERVTEQDPTTTNSEEETNTDPDTNTDTEQELFKDSEPIKANADEIREFGRLAQELSLFASCIGVPPPPTPATPDNPIACTSSSLHSKLLDPYTDADKTPTQASSSASPSQAEADAEAAALQAAHAEAVIAQRKAELQADLLELIQNEADGRNRDLILEIESLMRDWKGLHERLERWRGEKKGEKVREIYKRDMEE